MKSKNNSSTFSDQFNDKYLTNFLKNFSSTDKRPIPCSGYCETDLEGKILSVSEELLKVFRLQEFSVIGNRLTNFCYKGKSITGRIDFKTLVNEDFSLKTYELYLKNSSNEFLPSKININKRLTANGKLNRYCFIFTHINTAKKTTQLKNDNFQKDAILQAIIFASERIIQSAENISDVLIFDILRHLGIATRSNRVIIYENSVNSFGSNIMSLKYEWHSPRLFPIKENSALNNYKYPEKVFSQLNSGTPYQNRVDNIYETDSLLLKDHLIKSFILFPLFSKNKFWGLLSIADCETPRLWSNDEKDGLLASARLIGQIISKINNDNKIPEKEKLKLNKTYASPVCVIDKNARIIFKSTGFENFMGYSSAQTANLPLTAFIKSENDVFLKHFEGALFSPFPAKNIQIEIRTAEEKWQPVIVDLIRIDSADSNNPLVQLSIKSVENKESLNIKLCEEGSNNLDIDIELSIILNKIPDPIWITDKDNRFIYANKSFYKDIITGIHDKHLILGKKPEELPEKLNFLIKIIATDIAKKNQTKIEKEILKNNTQHIFNIRKEPILNNNNEYLGTFWFATDETKQKSLEKELIDTDKKYKTILENMPGAVFLKDSKGKYIYANSFMKKNYNISKTPVSAKNIFPEYLISKFTMEDLKVLREGKIETIDSFPDNKSKSFTFKKHKFPVPVNNKESLIGGIAIDISNELNAEEKIRRLETEIEFNKNIYLSEIKKYKEKTTKKIKDLENLVKNLKFTFSRYFKFFYKSPVLFFWCNLSGKIISVNGTWKKISNKRVMDIKGKNIDSILDIETRTKFHSMWRNILSKKIDSGEITGIIIGKNNKKINANFYMRLVEDKFEDTPPRIIIIAVPK